MSTPRYARLASKALGEVDSALESARVPSPEPADRARVITALGARLEARAQRRRLRAWMVSAGAAAAVVLAAFGGARVLRHAPSSLAAAAPPVPEIVARSASSSAVVVSGAASEPLGDGRPLSVGSRVVTPADGRATLSFSSGTSAVLHEGTAMAVASEGAAQVLRLETGALDLHVAKLGAGERFVVQTPDSEVEVRGTQFRVALVPADPSCGQGVVTRVVVTEGVVSVRHAGLEDRVPAGSQWPASCAAPAPSASVASTSTHAPRRTPAPSPAAGAPAASPAAGAPAAGSTLADQNDLFTAAMAARRRGESRAALALFDRFLEEYPSSTLVESAVVERMRLLHAASPARGRAAARDYMGHYPSGFARGEAEAILAEAP
ncbi:MAG TPA: FecR family protein [Polyangiaceae bacterium]|jgi:hypothetical protein|nr:FecR family protein [Polyangiaceae bacterium]